MFSLIYVGAVILTLEIIEEFIFDLMLERKRCESRILFFSKEI